MAVMREIIAIIINIIDGILKRVVCIIKIIKDTSDINPIPMQTIFNFAQNLLIIIKIFPNIVICHYQVKLIPIQLI
jgi:hypothetical protein